MVFLLARVRLWHQRTIHQVFVARRHRDVRRCLLNVGFGVRNSEAIFDRCQKTDNLFSLTFASCNVFACDDFPLVINKPFIGEMFHNGDIVNITWTGGRVHSNVVVQYRYAIYSGDQELDVEKDHINFRQYDWYVSTYNVIS